MIQSKLYGIRLNICLSKKIKETIITNKTGSTLINKTGLVSTTFNFPKSSKYNVFVRRSRIV